MKIILTIVTFAVFTHAYSQDIIDTFMSNTYLKSPSTISLTKCTDSLAKIYIDRLMRYSNNQEHVSYNGSGNDYDRISLPVYNIRYHESIKCPKGILAMYLICVILTKDTNLSLPLLKFTNRGKYRVKWYKYTKLIPNYKKLPAGGKFVGKKDFKRISKYLNSWYNNYRDSTMDVIRSHIPLEQTVYVFSD